MKHEMRFQTIESDIKYQLFYEWGSEGNISELLTKQFENFSVSGFMDFVFIVRRRETANG